MRLEARELFPVYRPDGPGAVCAITSTPASITVSTSALVFADGRTPGISLRMCDVDQTALAMAGSMLTTGLSPMNAPVKSLMPSRPSLRKSLEQFRGLLGRCRLFGQRYHSRGLINGVRHPWGNMLPARKDRGARPPSPAVNAAAQRQGISVGSEPRSHTVVIASTAVSISCMCFSSDARRAQRPAFFPGGLREMDVACSRSRASDRSCRYNRSPAYRRESRLRRACRSR